MCPSKLSCLYVLKGTLASSLKAAPSEMLSLSAVYISTVNHSHVSAYVFLNLLLDIICPITVKSHAGLQQTHPTSI